MARKLLVLLTALASMLAGGAPTASACEPAWACGDNNAQGWQDRLPHYPHGLPPHVAESCHTVYRVLRAYSFTRVGSASDRDTARFYAERALHREFSAYDRATLITTRTAVEIVVPVRRCR